MLGVSGEFALPLMSAAAREEADDHAPKQQGAPAILYPLPNAVDYAIETFADLIRPKEETPS
jgi:hypothetical protein